MTERPILFSFLMVRAILEGRKTQTRRLMKPQPRLGLSGHGDVIDPGYFVFEPNRKTAIPLKDNAMYRVLPLCPYGKPGDRLWVKESHRLVDCDCTETCRVPGYVWYEADSSGYLNASTNKLRPSIHMPRWASRITLEITNVRVARLQEISEEDAIAEGIYGEWKEPLIDTNPVYCMAGFTAYYYGGAEGKRGGFDKASQCFENLWSTIHKADGPNGWAANPWVWVLEFKRVDRLAPEATKSTC